MRKRSRNRKWKIRVILYVDNLMMHGNNSAMLSSFKEYLGSCFRMKDFRNLTYFSCLKVTRNVVYFVIQRMYFLIQNYTP